MQISTRQLYDRSSSLMQSLTARADNLQVQLATNNKLQNPSDDVAAYQKLAVLKRGTADDKAYGANIDLAKSLLSQSDTTLSQIENRLQRASELAVQANTGVLTDDARKVIGDELNAIVKDLVALTNTKDVRGQPLFGGPTGDTAVTQASDGSVSFVSTGDPAAIPIGDGVNIHASDSASRLFGGVTTPSGTSDMFTIISNFAAALSAGGNPTAAASAAGDNLKAALTQVTAGRSSVGVRAARLDLETDRLSAVATTRETARSGLEDPDVTATIAELQKTMTVLSATQASFSKLTSLSLFSYLR